MNGPVNYAAAAPAGSDSYVAAAMDNAPAWARAAINRARQARGLSPILPRREYAVVEAAAAAARATAEADALSRIGIWVTQPDGSVKKYDGRNGPRPVSRTSPTRPRAAQRHDSRGPLVTRVMMTAAYGEGAVADVDGGLPETLALNAFGSVEELNRYPDWDLRVGHHGPRLQVAGPRLRAHNSPAGLVVEWLPDLTLPWCRDAVAAINAGRNGVSVGMKVISQRLARLPTLTTFITEARLLHVALLTEEGRRPVYGGSRAKVFPSVYRDDADELKRNIDAVVENARWFSYRARRASQ